VHGFAGQKTEHHYYKSIYPEEEAQLYFAYQLGYSFRSRQNNIIVVKKIDQNKGYNLRFEVAHTRRILLKDSWVTAMIVKGSYGEGLIIYFKGPHQIIKLMLGEKSLS
jgi:hypothetical protein